MPQQTFETRAGTPSEGETFARLIERLRLAAEDAYMLGHLRKAQGPQEQTSGQGFLAIGELLERSVAQITNLATRRLD